jgi:hypothetical protein
MHDNGQPHVAGIVQHYFREVEIGQMQWPARSSDLNLINLNLLKHSFLRRL